MTVECNITTIIYNDLSALIRCTKCSGRRAVPAQRVGCRAKPVICRRRIYRIDRYNNYYYCSRSVGQAWGGCQNFLSSVRARSNPVFSRSVSTTDGCLRLRLRPPPPPQPPPSPLPPPPPLPLPPTTIATIATTTTIATASAATTSTTTTTTKRRNRDREVIHRPQTICRRLSPFPPKERGG